MASQRMAADKAPHGNSKVTREAWLTAARDRLVTRGVGDVKILSLSRELDVARSSFYWYFEDRADLLNALLAEWELRNTNCIIQKCAQPAQTVAHAVCHFFECFIDSRLFDPGLDFAVREWARRDAAVRAKIDTADTARLTAITALFARYGFDRDEADARARILYFMQLGYHALDVKETLDTRMNRIAGYLKGFTGDDTPHDVVAAFRARARELSDKT